MLTAAAQDLSLVWPVGPPLKAGRRCASRSGALVFCHPPTWLQGKKRVQRRGDRHAKSLIAKWLRGKGAGV